MNKAYQQLFEFIAAAERSRKYPSSTATSYKTPLRLIESELNEEEKESFETFKSHVDQIFQSYYSKNPSKMSAASYKEYKRRVKRLMDDYEKYGTDPTKMASWNREIVIRKKRSKGQEQNLSNTTQSLVRGDDQVIQRIIELGKFKVILPDDWDYDKAKEVLVNGGFKTVYDKLVELTPSLQFKQTKIENGEVAE